VEKNRIVFIISIILAVCIILSGFSFYIGSNAGFNRGVREAGAREIERIAIIEEYERRESEQLDREREENRREGERIERTDIAIKSLESLSGGTLTELQKLRALYSILADEHNSIRNDYFSRNNRNSGNGE